MARVSRNRFGNGWIKYYLNGDTYEGLDHDVFRHKKSWSKSSLSGMAGVRLIHDGTVVSIDGIGEFWQSDILEVPMRLNKTVKPKWVERRISKQISESDNFISIKSKPDNISFCFLNTLGTNQYSQFITIPKSYIGHWFVTTINPDTLKIEYYFSQDRV